MLKKVILAKKKKKNVGNTFPKMFKLVCICIIITFDNKNEIYY